MFLDRKPRCIKDALCLALATMLCMWPLNFSLGSISIPTSVMDSTWVISLLSKKY